VPAPVACEGSCWPPARLGLLLARVGIALVNAGVAADDSPPFWIDIRLDATASLAAGLTAVAAVASSSAGAGSPAGRCPGYQRRGPFVDGRSVDSVGAWSSRK
jgi:hypothetical protein